MAVTSSGLVPVHTKGSTSDGVLFVLSPWLFREDVGKVRVDLTLRSSTGGLRCDLVLLHRTYAFGGGMCLVIPLLLACTKDVAETSPEETATVDTAPDTATPDSDTAWGPLECRPCKGVRGSVASLDDLEAIRGCTELESLAVRGTDLTHLDALGCLESVVGQLRLFNNPDLKDVSGLSRLRSVGALYLTDNHLTSLEPLRNLTTIDGHLLVSEPYLPTLVGLEGVEQISGQLLLYGPGSESLEGLQNLRSVGQRVLVWDTLHLTDLAGLRGLEEIRGAVGRGSDAESLVILENAALVTLSGLEGLEHLDGSVFVSENPLLPDLRGLDGLRSCDNRVYLYQNAGLRSVDGLEALESADEVDFSTNDALVDIGALSNLTTAGTVRLAYNRSLTNVDGLTGIREASISLSSNPLTNVDGLINLERVGYLNIEGPLSDLSGLANLRESTDYIYISGVKGTSTLDGVFQSLEYAFSVQIDSNELLSLGEWPRFREGGIVGVSDSMTALGTFPLFERGAIVLEGDAFTSAGEFPALRVLEILSIENAFQMSTMPELPQLEAVGMVWIERSGLSSLADFPAMPAYTRVYPNGFGGYYNASIIIRDNPNLVDIEPLRELVSLEGSLTIKDNRRLCPAYITEVLEGAIIMGETEIENNGTIGCEKK